MTTPDEQSVAAMGICPGCDLPGSVNGPCLERACARRGLHVIPLEFGIDLPTDRDPNLGRMIDGMLIVSVLGIGGFGRVYRARTPSGDVALKLAAVTTRGVPDPIAADRLQREARVLGAIEHANVVKLLGSGEADGVPYLVLEHVEARNLEAFIASQPRFDAATIYNIVSQILDALAVAHAAGIIHRDVKPENVLVTEDLKVRVLDFGLAHTDQQRAVERPRSATVGTPTHMAPEQLTNTDIGPWTDVYGVGVIVFELLTGRLPFAGRTASAVLRERADPRRDVLDDAPPLPEALLDFLAMALAESPRDRFQSAGGMRAALEDALVEWDEFEVTDTPSEPLPPSERSTWFEDHDAPEDDPRESSIVTRARSLGATALQLAPLAIAAVLSFVVLGRPSAWPLIGPVEAQVAALMMPPPAPPAPEPTPVIDPLQEQRKDLVDRARRGTLAPSELASFESACLPELGCRTAALEGDPLRGMTVPGADGTLVLAFPAHASAAADECGTRFRRGRAIVGGTWDQIDAAWGGYVQPRIVLEAKDGRDVKVRKILVDRQATRDALDTAKNVLDAGFVVTVEAAQLGGVPLRAHEELRFQAAEGRFGEEGKVPCKLPTPKAFVLSPPLGAVEP